MRQRHSGNCRRDENNDWNQRDDAHDTVNNDLLINLFTDQINLTSVDGSDG